MTPEALIKSIEARGDLVLSAAERATLLGADPGNIMARKLLAADAFNRGDLKQAIALGRLVLAREPSPENEQNLVSCLMRAGQVKEAIERCLDERCQLPEITRLSRLSELYSRIGDRTRAVHWGRLALRRKDEAAPAVAGTATVRHRFDASKPRQNIIAYSLFGAEPRYVEGALRNTTVARYLYPGWTPRFYVDGSVPGNVLQALQREGAQIATVAALPAARYGLFWRFLVEDDPSVTHYLVRDADSVTNIKERIAVQQWLDSGEPFHVMRDWLSHSELVLAGMWGAQRGNLPGMGKRITAHVKARANLLNNRSADQLFLREEVWPQMRGRVCVHDPVFGFGATHETPPGYDLPGQMHVGQNDAITRRAPVTRETG